VSNTIYLEFDNAFLLATALCTLLMFIGYLTQKAGGLLSLLPYIYRHWLTRSGDGTETAIAFAAVLLGILTRSGSIWWWRASGAVSANFPFLIVATGDILMVAGMLCMIRVLAPDIRLMGQRYRVRVWIAVGLMASAFAVLSILT
jgi:hypothetical protein